jgi:arylformamidase
MRKSLLLGVMLLLCGTSVAAIAQNEGRFRERLRQRLMNSEAAKEAPAAGVREIRYGADPLQTFDFWQARRDGAPLVVFVHGGGWKRGDKRNATGATKVEHMLDQGYAVVSLNYRLVPQASVEDQAADVSSAIAYLTKEATRLKFNPAKIVLMGHSAGAHLSALVGTDEGYLANVGLSPRHIAGIVLLDGAAYDVPSQVNKNARLMGETYAQAFGAEPSRQLALSPISHVGSPDTGRFLVLHVDREDGADQSRRLAAALNKAGSQAEVQRVAGRGLRGHMEINRKLGEPDYPATALVDAFLRSVTAPLSNNSL